MHFEYSLLSAHQEGDGISVTAIREIMLLRELRHPNIVSLEAVHLRRQVGVAIEHLMGLSACCQQVLLAFLLQVEDESRRQHTLLASVGWELEPCIWVCGYRLV